MTQANRKAKAKPAQQVSEPERPLTRKRRAAAAKPYHHGELRQVLVDGALALIEEEGVAALSLREVARRIGVSHAAPYHHFEDRSLLLCAVAEQGFRALQQEMLKAVHGSGQSAAQRLGAVGVAYVRFAAANASQFRVMFSPDVVGERSNGSLKAASQATFSILTEGLLAAGLSKDVARDAALLAWSAVHGAAMLWIDRQLSYPEGPLDPAAPSGVDAFAQKLVGLLTKSFVATKAKGKR